MSDALAFADLDRVGRLPLTYDECRARFRRAALVAGLEVQDHPIDARGPDGQALTVDSVWIGPPQPERALVVLSGVHGVEGFIGSALQCGFLGRLAGGGSAGLGLHGRTAVLVVHAVNPWGMVWWRRQNESNVDLNRNWRRDETDPVHNEAYDELHAVACPDTSQMPSVDELMVAAMAMVDRRGFEWVRDGITAGQYRHADGLHFGGSRTEASTQIVQDLAEQLVGVDHALVLDLHTGHGPPGELTLLSDQPVGSPQDEFLRASFPTATVEATVGNPDATTGVKSGQISNGIRDLLGADRCHSTSAEFGTADDMEQLAATYLEGWVDRHGDRSIAEHAAVVWRYRSCFTPDDPEWEARCLASGAALLDSGLDAVQAWSVDV